MDEGADDKTAAGAADTPATGAKKGPSLVIKTQYLKDLSFENPGAPAALTTSESPRVGLNVDVNANKLAEKNFEVVLTLRAEAKREESTLFLSEVHYAGVFSLGDVAEEHVQLLLLIEAPRLLFPFARAILASSIREGGFPPLSVQPIDFLALYQQRVAQLRAQQEQAKAAAGNGQMPAAPKEQPSEVSGTA